MARLEAQSVGFDLPNFQLLTTILFRALGVGNQRAMQLLQSLNHQMPRTQQQYEELGGRMRSMGHLSERSPGNIGSAFGMGRGTCSGNFYTTLTSEAQPGNGPTNTWVDDPGESTALLAGGRPQSSWATSPPPREPQPHRSLWGEANPLDDGVATYL
eukprot:3589118-Pyramimonas_sp.AAC.1